MNYYFADMISGGFPDEIVLIMESGIITDEMLLTAYKKAKAYDEEGYGVDEWVNDELELEKMPPDDIEPEEEIRSVKKDKKKSKGKE